MKKYIPYMTLAFLLLVLGCLTIGGGKDLLKTKTSEKISGKEKSAGQNTANKYNLPVPAGSPDVTSVSIHYFFIGKLKELQKTDTGTRIIYENADPSLPDFVVTKSTRVARITQPYEENYVKINIGELKPGQNIEISAEFDLRTETWKILDVYLPTDKN